MHKSEPRHHPITMSFAAALHEAHEALRAAGYPSARIEVTLDAPDVDAAQREVDVAMRIIEHGVNPHPEFEFAKWQRVGARPLCVVNGVLVYARSR